MKTVKVFFLTLLSLTLLHAEILTVDTTAASGLGSLRYYAEGGYDGDIIQFAPGITYIDVGSVPINITHGITIDGPGTDALTITGSATSSGIFYINAASVVTLQNFAINEFGESNASRAILSDTQLQIDNLIITNSSGGEGQCIKAGGDLSILNSKISFCKTINNGSAIYQYLPAPSIATLTIANTIIEYNEGIDSSGTVYIIGNSDINITRSSIRYNTAKSMAGIGISTNDTYTAIITDINITDNNATTLNGGGIYAQNSNVLLKNSIIQGNSALTYGGGIYSTGSPNFTVADSIITKNSAGNYGGGVYATGDELDQLFIERSRVQENNASNGGGIYAQNGMQVKVEESVLSHNMATGGGGASFSNNSLYIDRSLFHDNSAQYAGGMVLAGSTQGATIVNTTVSNNHATAYGGGILANYATTSTSWADIRFCTVTANVADSDNGGFTGLGGGIAVGDGTQPADFVYLSQSIVAGNTLGDGSDNDLYGVAISNKGYNLIGVDTGNGFTDGVNNDIVGSASVPVDAKLTPLVNNGGPTFTHALLQDSPAINAAGSQALGYPAVDQRNFPRPQYDLYDIGAYESNYDSKPMVLSPILYYLLN